MTSQRQFVLIVPDGAADRYRNRYGSPLAQASTPWADFVARQGVNGRVQTLFEGLPRESMVATLGILGWDPRRHYPHGRASCELLAAQGARLGPSDIAMRANFVRIENTRLTSYNGNGIRSDAAKQLVEVLNRRMSSEFPDFELYSTTDFRNTLVIRDANIDPRWLDGPLPHESHGHEIRLEHLVTARDARAARLAHRLSRFLVDVANTLAHETANALFPWSPSTRFELSPFAEHAPDCSPAAVVGAMDFLHGICKAGRLDFVAVGNGRPDTDYRGKGEAVIRLLRRGYTLVVCHINAPDEASHMRQIALKVHALELIDQYVSGPAVRYFMHYPDRLGGVMILPDHYSNTEVQSEQRGAAHSMEPVPFALWNGVDRDGVQHYSEDCSLLGACGTAPARELTVLPLLLNFAGQLRSAAANMSA